jgi:predicted O-methyltransferase YrrM
MGKNFQYDWFSVHIPLFERHLLSFKGIKCSFLEIGTYEGRSATRLLENILTNADSKIVCIDLYKQSNLDFNLKETGAESKVDLRIGYSRDIIIQLAGDYDFVYIDGSHWSCDVLEDAVLAFRKVKIGGIIGFDDYLWDDPLHNQHGTPKIAIDTFLSCYAHKIEVIEHGYQVWLRKLSD